jgi:hypothetical protein
MEVVCFSETLVDFQWITWHYTPQASTLPNHQYTNLKSCIHIANKVAEKLTTLEFDYLNKDRLISELKNYTMRGVDINPMHSKPWNKMVIISFLMTKAEPASRTFL